MKKLIIITTIIMASTNTAQAFCQLGPTFYQCMEQERRQDEMMRQMRRIEEQNERIQQDLQNNQYNQPSNNNPYSTYGNGRFRVRPY